MAARAASRQLATLTRDAKDDALRAMADSLASTGEQLLEANEADVSAARDQDRCDGAGATGCGLTSRPGG